MFHAIVNANSVVQHLFQIKKGIIKYFNVNVKIMVHAKMIIVKILANAFVGTAII